jgi:threonylcarbamoyladenosine tRNA methylthiotransferase MtaB
VNPRRGFPVSFYTLGCKLNQLETEALAGAFREAGFPVLPWDDSERSALFIVNTCTVTSMAEQKARRIIRSFLRAARVVLVTGCYAELGGDELAALGGELFVVPGRAKDALLDLPSFLARSSGSGDPRGVSGLLRVWLEERRLLSFSLSLPGAATSSLPGPLPQGHPFRFAPRMFTFHSRAFVKIQDGCDRACAYCRVPLARGKSVSLAAAEVLARIKALEKQGAAEAVLTGVNISQYRDPADPHRDLPGLLRILLDSTGSIALRLSSIDPGPELFENSPGDFLEVLSHRRIRNHFHLSVQSGSDRILSAMGRSYLARDILKAAEKLRSLREDPFLACDIIAGFPGESAGDFDKTAALCGTIGFAWIHGFPYSRRPGTRAAAMGEEPGRRIAGERVRILEDMARRGRRAYAGRWLGKTLDAVAETGGGGPFFSALGANYLRIRVLSGGKRPKPGAGFRCRVTGEESAQGFDLRGELCVE